MASILVVEDDPAICWTLSQVLELSGHVVHTASNGAQGIELLHKYVPELVITDFEMPILDGVKMVQRIFVEDCGFEKIPVVLISGFPDLHVVAKSVGTVYFLPKPFEIDSLITLIDRALLERIPPHLQ